MYKELQIKYNVFAIYVFLILAVLDPKFKMCFYNNKYNNRRATVCKEFHLDTFYYHYYFCD